ncbi:MAG: hypothetical protein ACN6OI_06445 [Flavobacterium sp.]|uniref:hypothetical protein n=1 Tax=Flavobacterium sp. TaxID=239 RepID=UPI003D10FF23
MKRKAIASKSKMLLLAEGLDEKNIKMKKHIRFTVYIVCLIISSCKQSPSLNKIEEDGKCKSTNNESEIVYTEVNNSIKFESDLNESDIVKKIEITSSSINFLLRTIGENAYLNVGAINQQEPSSWEVINFNFFYNNSFEDAVKDIHLLIYKNQSDGYLMFPSTSEQYKTYYLYKYSKKTIAYLGEFEDDSSDSFKGKFIYNESQHNLYIQNEAKEIRKLKLLTIKSEAIASNVIEKEKKIITEQLEETYPSDLKGYWQTGCGNKFTELSVDNNEGYLSLNSVNAIFINLKVEKSSKEKEYILKYAGIGSQQNYYEDELKINEGEISEDKIIGRIVIQKDGKALLNWIGLYNMKKKKLEFVGKDFLLIRENGGKNPVLLEKCD